MENKPTARRLAVTYYLVLFVLSLYSLLLLEAPTTTEWRGWVSYGLLTALTFWGCLLLDSKLDRRALRFALAGGAAVFTLFCVASGWFLATFSTPLATGIDQLRSTGDLMASLAELELAHGLWILPALVVVTFLAGGALHGGFARWRTPNHWRSMAAGLTLVLAGAFVGEQVQANPHDGAYLLRAQSLPIYVQLFAGSVEPEVVQLETPTNREVQLDAIEPARNPKHVLIVGLESFRPELVNPQLTPNLARLQAESLQFTNARSDAILTRLSWNSLLRDASPVEVMEGRDPSDKGPWPLEVMKAAGYRVQLAFAGDLLWGPSLADELVGRRGPVVDRLHNEHGSQRDLADERATERLVSWIDEADTSSPNLLLLQLDGTHWDYDFPEEQAVVQPFAPAAHPAHLDDQDDLDLLYRRYQNAAHHVDRKVGRVLSALERRGMLTDTAIVVVADHGEGFTHGHAGHSALSEETQRIPLFFRLPGMGPRVETALVSQRHVWPTLCDYLQIPGVTAETFRGSSVLGGQPERQEVLTVGIETADLSFPSCTVRFRVRVRGDQAQFLPLACLDSDGRVFPDAAEALDSLPWREAIRRQAR